MISLTYVSAAVRLFSPAELLALLEKCRANNVGRGLTGLLLYKGGNFMQTLEGPEEPVQALHAIIARDPRHRGMITLLEHPLEERLFPAWSMGFRSLDNGETARETPGYSEFLNAPLTPEGFTPGSARCQRLLAAFKMKM